MRWHEPNLSIFHLESARARRVHGRTGCVERLNDLSLSYLSLHSAGDSGGSGVRILQDHSAQPACILVRQSADATAHDESSGPSAVGHDVRPRCERRRRASGGTPDAPAAHGATSPNTARPPERGGLWVSGQGRAANRYFPALLASQRPREQPQGETDFVCAVRFRPGTRPEVAPCPATLAHVAPCSRGWPRLRPARRYATRPNVGNRGRTLVSPHPHLQGGSIHEGRTSPTR
jgi:hypothetical protein